MPHLESCGARRYCVPTGLVAAGAERPLAGDGVRVTTAHKIQGDLWDWLECQLSEPLKPRWRRALFPCPAAADPYPVLQLIASDLRDALVHCLVLPETG
ncbi:MAG TPA: hypothetical protein VEZ24_12395 [Microvirga sp.]|nr:hypothetical protein [Microvirga sp.]